MKFREIFNENKQNDKNWKKDEKLWKRAVQGVDVYSLRGIIPKFKTVE